MVNINKMAIMAFMAWLHMAMNTTNNGRSEVKAELKNLVQQQRVAVDDQ